MASSKCTGADVGLLLGRLALGAIFIAHGLDKALGQGGPGGFADTLANLGLPQPQILAYATIVTEIGGGLLVALGIAARLGAAGLAVIMVVAIVKVHLPNGFFLTYKATEMDIAGWYATKTGEVTTHWIPHGIEFNVALLALALIVLFAGGGCLSVLTKRPKKG